MNVEFRPVTEENLNQILSLTVSEGQEGFIESVELCLKEAKEKDCWRPVGIYVNQVAVGFAMYCFWKEDPPAGRVWLDRYLIDWKYQGKGYGVQCLPPLLEKIQNEYGCRKIYLSVYEENQKAAALYARMGFTYTGELDEKGERIMVRDSWDKT